MSVRFKYYLRGCGLGILVASLVFIVSLHAHGGAMSDEKAMQISGIFAAVGIINGSGYGRPKVAFDQ